jgi:hypothetical protein
MAVRVLIDTDVWLDLGQDYLQEPLVAALEELVAADDVIVLAPEVVISEFERNKARVLGAARRSLNSHFQQVRRAVDRFGDISKGDTLRALAEIDHKIVLNGDAVITSMDRVEKLLKSAPPLPTTDLIKQRVTERALARKAPYHHEKNSVGDAVIIETYAAQRAAQPRSAFAFVTHNYTDFSLPAGDRRQPHEDIADLFVPQRSTFWLSLADLIRHISPDTLDDREFEFNAHGQTRGLYEILEAEYLLFRQVWYNRHWNLRHAIETGKHHVVPDGDYSRPPYRQNQTLDTVWAGALASAQKTEDEVGLENLGPWTDFEWGMLNGKLSALRWILGDEWDMLDT